MTKQTKPYKAIHEQLLEKGFFVCYSHYKRQPCEQVETYYLPKSDNPQQVSVKVTRDWISGEVEAIETMNTNDPMIPIADILINHNN
jgi:hypothetical protein